MRSKHCFIVLSAITVGWSSLPLAARAADDPAEAAAISMQTVPPASEQAGILTQTAAPPAGARLVWDLAPPDPHGTDAALAAIRLGPDGQARTNSEYQTIRDRYSAWLTSQGLQPGTSRYVEAFGKLTAQETAGAVLKIQLSSWLDEAGVKALSTALSVDGVPAPRIEPLGYVVVPGGFYGMTLRWAVLPAARFRGIEPDQASTVSDEEQQAQLQAQLAAVRGALAAWNAKRQADLAALNLQAPLPAPVLAELHVGTVLRGWEVRTNLPDGDAVELAKVLAQPGLVEPQVVRPANYGLDRPNGGQPGQFKRISPDELARLGAQLLSFELVDRGRLQGFAPEEFPALFTASEQAQLSALADNMERALVDWNAHHASIVRARLERQVTAGIVTGVEVLGPDHSIETVLSLGAALSVPGAPVYRYGSGFTMRNDAYSLSEMFNSGSSVGASVVFMVPRSASAGTSAATGPEVAAAQLAQSQEQTTRLYKALTTWIAQRTDLRLLPEGTVPGAAGGAQIWGGSASTLPTASAEPLQLSLELRLTDQAALDAAVADLKAQIVQLDPEVSQTVVLGVG